MKRYHYTVGYQTSYAGRPWQSHEVVISAKDGDAAVESAKKIFKKNYSKPNSKFRGQEFRVLAGGPQ